MSYRLPEVKPIGGFYPRTKVYSDGNHYIAIPHTERPYRPKKKHVEEVIEVKEEQSEKKDTETLSENSCEDSGNDIDTDRELTVNEGKNEDKIKERRITKKQLFEELYKENLYVKRKERRNIIVEKMLPYFNDEKSAKEFVDRNMERKLRNLITRRVRLTRKANLQDFNYFVTFTYDSAIHNEESFKKRLSQTLRRFCTRKSWRYIGVWERSPEKKRLHFHGIFNIPEGTMPGSLEAFTDYNKNKHKMVTTMQNLYFNERFGRSDFKAIEGNGGLGECLAYIMKYIEKSGEKIVYSRGLPQFFISDIITDDVVCHIGAEDGKLLLFDDFKCWDEGVLVGEVSKETIKQLRKAN